jgi:hypothetical protein
MEYLLYFNNNDNKYYLITNEAINYNIVIEFETFNNLLLSNETLSNYICIEFNDDNLNNFLKEFKFSSFNNKFYRFNNWLDVFDFYKDI